MREKLIVRLRAWRDYLDGKGPSPDFDALDGWLHNPVSQPPRDLVERVRDRLDRQQERYASDDAKQVDLAAIVGALDEILKTLPTN